MAENKGSSKSTKKITVTQKKSSGSGSGSGRSKNTASNSSSKKSSSSKKANAKRVTRPSERLIHKFLPAVWFLAALFLLLCLILGKTMGPVGEGTKHLFGGLFGIGAYPIVLLFVYLGIMWRKLIDRHRIALKTILLSSTILLFSALCQVFVLAGSTNEAYPGVSELFNAGARISGGGFIGGSLGWLSFAGLKVIGSSIILIFAMLVLMMLVLDITPLDIMERIKLARAERAERIEAERRLAEEEEARTPAVIKTVKEAPRREKRREPEPLPEAKREPEPQPLELDEPEPVQEMEKDAVITEGENEPEPQTDEPPFDDAPVDDPDDGKTMLQKVFDERELGQLHANDDDDSAPQAFGMPDDEGDIALAAAEPAKAKWVAPPIDLLVPEDKSKKTDQTDSIAQTKHKLLETLASFDIRVKDIGYSIGPTITRYEIFPDAGVRVRAIANLVDDIALNLAAGDIRIEAPIPNKPAVGVEVPNTVRSTVRMRGLIDTDTFRNSSPLTVALGQDVGGKSIFFDIKKMPHMIIAGTTGSGKSVCINGIVCSLLYKNPPDKVKLIMIDPKKVEFSIYQHIPHLHCPIISDSRKAAGALCAAVAEMERRYTLVEDVGVRDVDSYNQVTANDPDREFLPKLIIVIDELADLMMTAKADVEQFITRIAQKARAVGIHLIIGTQRPSVDVITGLIKANVPSRIACTVKSQVDSRTILDIGGAEKLVGQGDMLFSPIGLAKPMRVQGAFLEDAEVARVVNFIKENNEPVEYNRAFMDSSEAAAANVGEKKVGGAALDAADMSDDNGDNLFRQAVEIAIQENKISTSLLQRKLSIGYGRAAKIIDQMEDYGYVSPSDGNKPRRILITKQEFYEKSMNDTVGE